MSESFSDFKSSFSYGSRSDLAFKFLKRLTDAEAGAFFEELLSALGETVDDGDADRLIEVVYRWQVRAYEPREGESRRWVYDDAPFTPMRRPVAETTLALLTSSGHFVDDPEPFGVRDMTQAEAEKRIQEFLRVAPQLSAIPIDVATNVLRVRHGGYDVRGARADPNTALPIEPLRKLAAEGRIGDFLDTAFSFVGAAAQGRVRSEAAPEWADDLVGRGVEAVVLVPL